MTRRIEWLVAFCLIAMPSTSAQQSSQAAVTAEQTQGASNLSDSNSEKADNDEVRAKLEHAIGTQRVLPIAVTESPENASEKRIHEALDKTVSVKFVGLPLLECMQQLSNQTNVPMVVDKTALAEIGLEPDLPIDAVLNDVTLRNVINLLGRDLECTYLVKNEVLYFTTNDAAEEDLKTEVYQLSGRLAAKGEALAKIVPQVVRPDSWEVLGGFSVIVSLDDQLVVSTTDAMHYEVQELLYKLNQKYNQVQETADPLTDSMR